VLAILLLLVACKKNEQTPTTTPPATTITSLSSQILNAGDPLLLRGKALEPMPPLSQYSLIRLC